jgi:threonine/homoserine/homoserine lactone efflux protein
MMFGIQNLEIFLPVALALNLTPGQDTLYIIGRSLSQGRWAGIVSVLGIGTGCVFHITAASIGLYSLLMVFPVSFTALCLGGGIYLVYLGIMTIAHQDRVELSFHPGNDPEGIWQIYRQGLLTNLLNPKVALFFIAFLPQFIDHPASDFRTVSFLFLGLVFLFTGTIWCLIVAVCASACADTLRNNPKIQRGFVWFTGLLFAGLGCSILLTHV